jgi:hypothetical protein
VDLHVNHPAMCTPVLLAWHAACIMVWILAAAGSNYFTARWLATSGREWIVLSWAHVTATALVLLPGRLGAVRAAARTVAPRVLAVGSLHMFATGATVASSAMGSVTMTHMLKLLEPFLTVLVGRLLHPDQVDWRREGFWGACLSLALLYHSSFAHASAWGRGAPPFLALLGSIAFILRNLQAKGGGGDGEKQPTSSRSSAQQLAPPHAAAGLGAGVLSPAVLLCTGSCAAAVACFPLAFWAAFARSPTHLAGRIESGAAGELSALMALVGSALLTGVYQGASMFVLADFRPVQHAALNLTKRLISIVAAAATETSLALPGPSQLITFVVVIVAHVQLMRLPKRGITTPLLVSSTASHGRPEQPAFHVSPLRQLALALLALVVLASGGVQYASILHGATEAEPTGFLFRFPPWGGRGVQQLLLLQDVLRIPSTVTIVRSATEDIGCADLCSASTLTWALGKGEAQFLTAGSLTPGAAFTARGLFAEAQRRQAAAATGPGSRWAGADVVSASPLELMELLRETPLQRWLDAQTRWKLMAGPLFPQQLDYAAQLALLLRRGGAVALGSTVLASEDRGGARGGLSESLLDACSRAGVDLVALQAGVGTPHPAVLVAAGPRLDIVTALLADFAAQLDACDSAAPSSPGGGACVLTPGDLMGRWYAAAGCTAAEANQTGALCSRLCIAGIPVATRGTCNHRRSTSAANTSATSVVYYADCDRESLEAGIGEGSLVGVAFAAQGSSTCSQCRILPRWHGSRQRVLAVIGYGTLNIGDDTQSVASAAFLPRIDAFVDRDSFTVMPHPGLLAPITPSTEVRFVGNAFWKARVHADGSVTCNTTSSSNRSSCGPLELRWPVPPTFRPFFASVHLSSAITANLLMPLVDYQSMPTRDTASAARLAAEGAAFPFFAACFTLSLRRRHLAREPIAKRSSILVVPTGYSFDDDFIASVLPPDVQAIANWSTQDVSERLSFVDPLRYLLQADARIGELASARLVFTSRLHVALPCIGMGTPVIFVLLPQNVNDPRFSGYVETLLPVTGADDPRIMEMVGSRAPSPSMVSLRARAAAVLRNLVMQEPELERAAWMLGALPTVGEDEGEDDGEASPSLLPLPLHMVKGTQGGTAEKGGSSLTQSGGVGSGAP